MASTEAAAAPPTCVPLLLFLLSHISSAISCLDRYLRAHPHPTLSCRLQVPSSWDRFLHSCFSRPPIDGFNSIDCLLAKELRQKKGLQNAPLRTFFLFFTRWLLCGSLGLEDRSWKIINHHLRHWYWHLIICNIKEIDGNRNYYLSNVHGKFLFLAWH